LFFEDEHVVHREIPPGNDLLGWIEADGHIMSAKILDKNRLDILPATPTVLTGITIPSDVSDRKF
jgi:hypothetical protein